MFHVRGFACMFPHKEENVEFKFNWQNNSYKKKMWEVKKYDLLHDVVIEMVMELKPNEF